MFNFGPNDAGYYPNGSPPLGLTYAGADRGAVYDGKSPLYGWTNGGGSNPDDRNVVFAYDPGRCGFAVLHTFDDLQGGFDPAGLTVGPDGAVYGVITSGPTASDTGAVFRIGIRHGCTVKWYKLIYTFKDTHPQGAMTFGPDGDLYLSASGTIYRLNLNRGWKRTPLYTFTEFGHGPGGRMVFGSDGALYGADLGDVSNNTAGTVYRLRQTTKHNGKVVWVRDTLYSFVQNDPQGNNPTEVSFGRDGILYGITSDNGSGGYGTVFSVTPQPGNPDGLPWNMTLLHAFSGTDGDPPTGTLAFGSDGAIYGATVFGSPTYPDDYIHGYAFQLVH